MSGEQKGVRERAAEAIVAADVARIDARQLPTARHGAAAALASLDHPETVDGLAEVLGAHQHTRPAWECTGGDHRTYEADLDDRRRSLATHHAEVALRWLAGGAT